MIGNHKDTNKYPINLLIINYLYNFFLHPYIFLLSIFKQLLNLKAMKTSGIFTVALCAMVVAMGAASCKKDNNGNAGDRMTIGANIGQHDGDGAKTEIGDETNDQFPILWSEGDAFALYSKTSTSGSPFAITSGIGSESGLFEGANPGDAPYFASYPYGVNGVTRTGETTFAYEIPQDQTGLNHAGPMVGYSADGKSVSFDNAMSWVRIGLKGEAKVTKVEMSYSEAKGTPVPLSGTLTITVDGNGGITSTSVAANRKAEAQKLYRDCDVTLTADNAYFDFLVPAGAFGGSTEAKFKVFGTDNVQLAAFNKTMPEIERNMVYVGEYGEAINEPAAHEYVDFGFPSGTLWATCNVGADSPEDYGWYFMWGSTTNGGDSDCLWRSCPGNGGDYSYNATAFNTWKLSNLTNNVLKPGVDAASVNRGGDWRMPTSAQFEELYNNTVCTWTTENGVNGCKFVSKTDAAKYIFLPAAGYREGLSVWNAGSRGRYWLSSLDSSDPSCAYRMCFTSGPVSQQNSDWRYYGCTVRPVRVAR